MTYDLQGKRVWVTGHRGMVGGAVLRRLGREDCVVITASRDRVDLKRQLEVERFLGETRPDVVVIAAAKVGGILANSTAPADFLYDNLMIVANLVEASHRRGVERLLFLGSSCIYPKHAAQPIVEDALLTGPLEPTNEAYAVAKIAGIKMVKSYREQHGRDYISAMPSNLYGPGDNFDLASSHVMPALLRKAHEAKQRRAPTLEIWGTGTPRREFLHVDDCADALVFLLKTYSQAEHVNIGSGSDISILELTRLICEVVGYEGEIVHDLSKPDGTPRKLMSAGKMHALGWTPSIALREGISAAYAWYLQHVAVSASEVRGQCPVPVFDGADRS